MAGLGAATSRDERQRRAVVPATAAGGVFAGLRPGRTPSDQISLFNSVGLAIQDMASACPLLDLAEAQGVGIEVDLSGIARACA